MRREAVFLLGPADETSVFVNDLPPRLSVPVCESRKVVGLDESLPEFFPCRLAVYDLEKAPAGKVLFYFFAGWQ